MLGIHLGRTRSTRVSQGNTNATSFWFLSSTPLSISRCFKIDNTGFYLKSLPLHLNGLGLYLEGLGLYLDGLGLYFEALGLYLKALGALP